MSGDFILKWFREGDVIPAGSSLVDREERVAPGGQAYEYWFLMGVPAERAKLTWSKAKPASVKMEEFVREGMQLADDNDPCQCDECRMRRQNPNPFAQGVQTVLVTMEGDPLPPSYEEAFRNHLEDILA